MFCVLRLTHCYRLETGAVFSPSGESPNRRASFLHALTQRWCLMSLYTTWIRNIVFRRIFAWQNTLPACLSSTLQWLRFLCMRYTHRVVRYSPDSGCFNMLPLRCSTAQQRILRVTNGGAKQNGGRDSSVDCVTYLYSSQNRFWERDLKIGH